MRRSDWPRLSIGQAIFVGGGRTSIEVGANGLSALIAYPASRPIGSLLQRLAEQSTRPAQPVAADLCETHRPGRGAHMTPLRKIAVIGNSLPRRCGIATFTTDLQRAISNSRPNLQTCIVAMTDHDQTYDYPASVALQIKDDSIEDYVARRGVSERRPVRRRLPAARIRNFRRRSRGPYPGAAVAPDHAGRHDAAHGAGRADARLSAR